MRNDLQNTLLRRFSYSGYRTSLCLMLLGRVSLPFILLLTCDVSSHKLPASSRLLLPFALLICSAGHRKFFLGTQSANPQPNFNFLNPQPQVRNWTFKKLSPQPQVRNDFSGFLNPKPQVRNFLILEVRNRKSATS